MLVAEGIQIERALLVQKTTAPHLLLLRVERAPITLETIVCQLMLLLLSRLARVELVPLAVGHDYTRGRVDVVVGELFCLVLAAKMIVELGPA